MRAIYSLFILCMVTIILTPCVYLFGLFGRSKRRAYIMVRFWARTLIALFMVKIHVQNREKVDFDQPVIYMSNHLSQADIPILMTAIPAGLAFISKRILGKIPFLGWSMIMVGMVFISRRNAKQAQEILNDAISQIAPNMNFMIFPEGTRSDLEGKRLAPIKKGGFHMALLSGRAIQPVAIVGSQKLMPKGSLAIRSGEVEVRFGNPIYVLPDSTAESLMLQYQQEMEQLFALQPVMDMQAEATESMQQRV